MPSVTVGDTDIVYHQSGEGPDIVWIAGGGDNGAPWRKWNTPAFDDAFRNTSFANRGVGETVCRAPRALDDRRSRGRRSRADRGRLQSARRRRRPLDGRAHGAAARA